MREGVLEYTRRAPYPGPEEQLDLPAGTESNPQALDDFLDGVFDKFSDSGDLLTALVLSASPTEVKLARSSREIITITDKKVLGVVARALNDKAKPEQRIKRGSVVTSASSATTGKSSTCRPCRRPSSPCRRRTAPSAPWWAASTSTAATSTA